VHALQGVGRNLHDHPLLELDFAGSERLRSAMAEASASRFVPEEQTLGKLRSSLATGPYDLHLIPVAAPEHSLLEGRTILAVGAMQPSSRGRPTLASADPSTAPGMDHGYLSYAHDVAVLAEGVERARELAATEPLRSLTGEELVPGRGASLDDAIRRTHVHYYHPVGTCKLGRADDRDAVCDADGRVHGLERIADALLAGA
jgi:choline dehydrogenase